MRPVGKWGNVLISDRKRCFGKTDAVCWKSQKSGVPSAKMLKRADLRLKKLFCTNSCTFLKTLRSGVPRVKMTKHADLGLKTLLCKKSCTLLEITCNWCAQCKNDKTCWSRANNAVFLFGQTRALCWKELRSGALSAKMLKRADLRLKKLFCTNSCTFLKTLRSSVPGVKMTKHADLGLKTLLCTNSCTLLKIANKWWAQCENDKSVLISGWKRCFVHLHALCWKALKNGGPNAKVTKACWSRAENAVLHKLRYFVENH